MNAEMLDAIEVLKIETPNRAKSEYGIIKKNAFNTIMDIVNRYQKIEEIINRPVGNDAEEKAYNYMMMITDIKEVMSK